MSDPIFLHELADRRAGERPKPPDGEHVVEDVTPVGPTDRGAADAGDNVFSVHGAAAGSAQPDERGLSEAVVEGVNALLSDSVALARHGRAAVAGRVRGLTLRRRRPAANGGFGQRAHRPARAIVGTALVSVVAALAAVILFSGGDDRRATDVASADKPGRTASASRTEPALGGADLRPRAREQRPRRRKDAHARSHGRPGARRGHPRAPARPVTRRKPSPGPRRPAVTPAPPPPATPGVGRAPAKSAPATYPSPAPAPAPAPSPAPAPAGGEPDEFGFEE